VGGAMTTSRNNEKRKPGQVLYKKNRVPVSSYFTLYGLIKIIMFCFFSVMVQDLKNVVSVHPEVVDFGSRQGRRDFSFNNSINNIYYYLKHVII
jgi:hypothetical protein